MAGGSGLILGIESSCDETAAAVVRGGREVLSNVVASQMSLHANYGGVVPELASREHLRNIVPVVREAMSRAGVGFEDLEAVAVTEGPGLAGALLVGITYAKALAFGLGRPLVGVNHLEGHIHAVLMDAGAEMEGPLLALVVSGGHTHLYVAEQVGGGAVSPGDAAGDPTHDGEAVLHGAPGGGGGATCLGGWRYRNVGRTVDDAAGEAYDKVAKLLGLGYPGGPWIDALAARGNAKAVAFQFGPIRTRVREGVTNKKAPVQVGDGPRFDFSFSGIKTAVLRYLQANGMQEEAEARRRESALRAQVSAARPGAPAMVAAPTVEEVAGLCDQRALDLMASFQGAVVGNLLKQTFAAAEAYGARGIVVSGGVAANGELRRRFAAEGERRGMRVAFPSRAMSTDNAAMIAAAGWGKYLAGEFAGEEMGALPQLKLG